MARTESTRPRAVLICHGESTLNREGVARWLASFTDLAGMVLIEEDSAPARARIKREVRRIGVWRFLGGENRPGLRLGGCGPWVVAQRAAAAERSAATPARDDPTGRPPVARAAKTSPTTAGGHGAGGRMSSSQT